MVREVRGSSQSSKPSSHRGGGCSAFLSALISKIKALLRRLNCFAPSQDKNTPFHTLSERKWRDITTKTEQELTKVERSVTKQGKKRLSNSKASRSPSDDLRGDL